jgi:acyl carrier protein
MSEPDPVFETIRALVARIARPGRVPAHCDPETRLSEGGFWLDSVELLEVVVACEEEFRIVFDATRDLTDGALETLGSLTALIGSKRRRSPSIQ